MRPKIWSLGTHLGYPGAGSLGALDETFSKFQILVIWDPNSLPILVACRETAKTPKTFPPWCDPFKYILLTFQVACKCALVRISDKNVIIKPVSLRVVAKVNAAIAPRLTADVL